MKTILFIVAVVVVGHMLGKSKPSHHPENARTLPHETTAVVFETPAGMIRAHKEETKHTKPSKAKSVSRSLEMKCGQWGTLANDANQMVRRCEYL